MPITRLAMGSAYSNPSAPNRYPPRLKALKCYCNYVSPNLKKLYGDIQTAADGWKTKPNLGAKAHMNCSVHDLSDRNGTRESEWSDRRLTGFPGQLKVTIRNSVKTLRGGMEKTNQVIDTTGLDVIDTAGMTGVRDHHFSNFGNRLELSNKD